jgi:hypothetical protein
VSPGVAVVKMMIGVGAAVEQAVTARSRADAAARIAGARMRRAVANVG